jgi:4-hydroxy 2-oxovalerate aldolase
MSAGAGNPAAEALVAVLERLGIATGIDVEAIADAAETVVRPLRTRMCAGSHGVDDGLRRRLLEF